MRSGAYKTATRCHAAGPRRYNARRMPRPARRLFTLCSAVSLLLCIALCVLWVRSYRVGDGLQWWSAGRDGGVSYHRVTSDSGQVAYKNTWEQGGTRPPAGAPQFRRTRWEPVREGYPPDPEALVWAGFHWQKGDGVYSGPFTLVGLPYWFLAGATAVLPLYRLARRAHARRRANRGRCSSCGYDLRATADRCPECGTLLEGKGEA